jgi:formate hydrogenlyase subunit 3/multisubunit Na+/H+ antiporter MnhD subunit
MQELLISVVLLLFSGFAGLITSRLPRASTILASAGAVTACAIGLLPALRVLAGRDPALSLLYDWHLPVGAFSLGVDPLSAFFLVPIFVLTALAAVYGAQYMQAYRTHRSLGVPCFFFNLLAAGMVTVVIARNGLVFLVAWELMSLSAYFLVTFEHERDEARRAGWLYLVATHLGTAFLFAMFVLLGRPTGNLDFDAYRQASTLGAGWSAALFLLAIVGFGAKAGFVPYHVWLPEAHPAAPSHVSAVMSGVMIKTGIYGILRVMTFMGEPAWWWGPVLVVIGLVGGLVGISLALYQRDLKRALAYSSIENVGLITLGLGIGVWGLTSGHPTMAVLGLAGGLLHVWNHALMKGLMFFAAGSVLHGTGTKDIERLGGVMKQMPWTGTAMTFGAVAISGLPPLNGFVSEWLLYMGLIRGGLSHQGVCSPVLLLSVGAVALIGGLALTCFVRLVGTVLLGDGRSEQARHAHESPRWLTLTMGVLVALCVAIALVPRFVISAASGVAQQIFGISAAAFMGELDATPSPLGTLGAINILVWIVVGLVAVALGWARRRGTEAADATWGCGYAHPAPRMQYTGASFAEFMVRRVFPRFLRTGTNQIAPSGLFPRDGSLTSQYPDPLNQRVYEPFFAYCARRFARLRWVQQGKLQFYLGYIVVVVVLSFVWVSFRAWIRSG